MSLAGRAPRVLTTPTQDLGSVLSSVHGVKIEGEINVVSGVQVAHLALKHRQNKHQRMRIVMFIGSPISAEEEELRAVGKKLRKCNVAVDVVSFGDVEANKPKLEAFMSSVNKNNNSNLVEIEAGANLADVLCGTAIFNQDGPAVGSGFAAAAAAAQSQAAMGGFSGEGGDMGDMGDDPALMMALRISLEEERARQAAMEARGEGSTEAAAEASTEGAGSVDTSQPAHAADPMMLDDDALLQQALALSMGQEGAQEGAPAPAIDEEDDPELAAALAMSLREHTENADGDTA
ncbi:hypothetical protein BE221DRAFT_3439 [Ostreococcus tauri]|nr:hypothetical protein BE221DRAFT_3439 [Ostreococcus tauri]